MKQSRSCEWTLPRTAAAALLLAAGSLTARAADDDAAELSRLGREVVEAQVKALQATGELNGLTRYQAILGSAPTTASSGEVKADRFIGHPSLWKDVVKALSDSEEIRRKNLDGLQDDLNSKEKKAEGAWRAMALDGGEFHPDGPRAARPDLIADLVRDLLPTLGWGALAIFGTIGLLTLDHRKELLRRFRIAGAISLALTSLGQGAGCGGTPPADPVVNAGSAVDEHAKRKEALRAATQDARQVGQKAAALEARLEAEEERLARARLRQILVIDEPDGKLTEADKIRSLEAEAQQKLRDMFKTAGKAEAFGQAGSALAERIVAEWEDRRVAALAVRRRALIGGGLGLTLSLGFLYATLLPLRQARTRRAVRRSRTSEQCPRCLDRNLMIIESQVTDAFGRPIERVECQSNSCRYDFNAKYRDFDRLCLPTLGIKDSGKTRWLLTVYEKISNGTLPLPTVLENLPSRYDRQFVDMIRDYIEPNRANMPTAVELPSPLIVYHRDNDPIGRKELLLNIFDYSGEMMFADLMDLEAMRRRALLSDAFILFLDPTQVLPGNSYSITHQIEMFNMFCNDIREVRGLRPGEPIDLAVAVCISKIDLLTTQNPLGGMATQWVGHLRESAALPITLKLIQQRSHFCAQAMPALFPGLDIETRLRNNFGPRYQFFPLSPVGIDQAGLGNPNLEERLRAPFGVMEPLYWLLHVHGYDVFGSRRRG